MAANEAATANCSLAAVFELPGELGLSIREHADAASFLAAAEAVLLEREVVNSLALGIAGKDYPGTRYWTVVDPYAACFFFFFFFFFFFLSFLYVFACAMLRRGSRRDRRARSSRSPDYVWTIEFLIPRPPLLLGRAGKIEAAFFKSVGYRVGLARFRDACPGGGESHEATAEDLRAHAVLAAIGRHYFADPSRYDGGDLPGVLGETSDAAALAAAYCEAMSRRSRTVIRRGRGEEGH